MLTSAKLTEGYLVVGITRELNKEPSLDCSSIYINTMWSMLQQYLPALMFMYHSHVLLLIHHKATMLRTKEVDLTFSIFFSYFYFIFDLVSCILFLELGLGLE